MNTNPQEGAPASSPALRKKPHCDDCAPEFTECWNDGSLCRKRPINRKAAGDGGAPSQAVLHQVLNNLVSSVKKRLASPCSSMAHEDAAIVDLLTLCPGWQPWDDDSRRVVAQAQEHMAYYRDPAAKEVFSAGPTELQADSAAVLAEAKAPDRWYGLKHQERLHPDLEDVVETVIDSACETAGEPFEVTASRIAWPIEVRVFRPMDVSRHAGAIARNVLECAMEMLDEEYADPDGKASEPTPAMKQAAEAFAKVVVAEYRSWACVETGEIIRVSMEQARAMLGEGGENEKGQR